MREIAYPSAHPKTIQAALRKTTETLAGELGRPSHACPRWSPSEWLIARAAAAIHGVSPLLSSRLLWEGPPGWKEFLTAQKEHATRRHARLEQLLKRVDEGARSRGLAVVALKGAALHAMGLYTAGERPMADVDLLVRPLDTPRATELLESLGFQQAWVYWKHRVFTTNEPSESVGLGEHSDAPIKVELHDSIREVLPFQLTDMSKYVFPATTHPGLNAYPSKAALMTHLLFHAAGAMAYRRVRLLNLHDIASLSQRMTLADWDDLLGEPAKRRELWWALPPLQLTARYYTGSIPHRALDALAACCPWVLTRVARRRRVADVSLSYIWVEAFPGLAWARSSREIIQYVASRIRPNEDTLAMRAAMSKETWAARDPWCHLSHGRRMLRYATSRLTRAASMHPVHAALGQSP